MVMYAWSSIVDEPPRAARCASEQIPSAANGYGGSNYTGFSDPQMDADIERAESELDPAKQKPIWAEMQRDLRRAAAGAAAVLPLRGACRAEMAQGLRADRP